MIERVSLWFIVINDKVMISNDGEINFKNFTRLSTEATKLQVTIFAVNI